MSTPENIRNIRHLGNLTLELDQAVKDLKKFEEIAVDAEADYQAAKTRAYENATGAVETRKMAATGECVELWRTWGKAVALVNYQKAHIRALHTRIDVGRTIQATARAEINLGGLIT